MLNWFNFGKTIYKDKNIKEYKRLVVFLIRVFFNRANINGLISFFSETYFKKNLSGISRGYHDVRRAARGGICGTHTGHQRQL